jgi:plasmid stabilization system protein ParE
MKLTYRPQAESDLRWFSHYYHRHFPEGRKQANQHLRVAIALLLENPFVGPQLDGAAARRHPIRRTPFVLVYTVVGDTVDILRVWDARADPTLLNEK